MNYQNNMMNPNNVMLGQNNAMMGQNMANAGPIDYRAMYPFVMPAAMESDFSAEEMAEDMDGMTMAFQRVKIPGGGTLQFEMPSDDPDRPEYSTSLVGVILYNHASHAYWAGDSSEEENNPPVCSSLDGKTGIGIPGGACAACQLNKFRTASKGKGKACKNMRVLYLLRSGDYMPLQLNLPPTSIKAFQDFVSSAFIMRRRATCGSMVQITLRRESNGKDTYSVAVFKRLYDFTGEELAQIRAYAGGFKEQIMLMQEQQAKAMTEQQDDLVDYVDDEDALPAGDEPFVMGQVLDGDREALPE